MTNSSWTQAHITDLLNTGRRSILAGLMLMDDKAYELRAKQGREVEEQAGCKVVFPPCDTGSLQGLGNLDSRKRELVSLAQFRYVSIQFSMVETHCLDRKRIMQSRFTLWRSYCVIIPSTGLGKRLCA